MQVFIRLFIVVASLQSIGAFPSIPFWGDFYNTPPTNSTGDDAILNPQNPGCDPNWKDKLSVFTVNQQNWLDAIKIHYRCYSFTLERSCYCPSDTLGPFKVDVRQNKIADVSPINVNNSAAVYDSVLSMDQLFALAYINCFQNCPDFGAVDCEIQYASKKEGSYITSLMIDFNKMIADEEWNYYASNLTFCH